MNATFELLNGPNATLTRLRAPGGHCDVVSSTVGYCLIDLMSPGVSFKPAADISLTPSLFVNSSTRVTVKSAEKELIPSTNVVTISTSLLPAVDSDMWIRIVPSAYLMYYGSNYTYSVTIGNSGPSASSGVTLLFTLPPQMTFYDLSITRGATRLVCSVGSPDTKPSTEKRKTGIPISCSMTGIADLMPSDERYSVDILFSPDEDVVKKGKAPADSILLATGEVSCSNVDYVSANNVAEVGVAVINGVCPGVAHMDPGNCSCFAGYTGPNCTECDVNYSGANCNSLSSNITSVVPSGSTVLPVISSSGFSTSNSSPSESSIVIDYGTAIQEYNEIVGITYNSSSQPVMLMNPLLLLIISSESAVSAVPPLSDSSPTGNPLLVLRFPLLYSHGPGSTIQRVMDPLTVDCDRIVNCSGNGICESAGSCLCFGNYNGSCCGGCLAGYMGANCLTMVPPDKKKKGDEGFSTVAIAFIVVGCVLAILFVSGSVWLAVRRRRHRRQMMKDSRLVVPSLKRSRRVIPLNDEGLYPSPPLSPTFSSIAPADVPPEAMMISPETELTLAAAAVAASARSTAAAALREEEFADPTTADEETAAVPLETPPSSSLQAEPVVLPMIPSAEREESELGVNVEAVEESGEAERSVSSSGAVLHEVPLVAPFASSHSRGEIRRAEIITTEDGVAVASVSAVRLSDSRGSDSASSSSSTEATTENTQLMGTHEMGSRSALLDSGDQEREYVPPAAEAAFWHWYQVYSKDPRSASFRKTKKILLH